MRSNLWPGLLGMALAAGCGAAPRSDDPAAAVPGAPHGPVLSLAGQALLPPATVPDQARLEADLAQARADVQARPDDPEALIWLGRRLGYLWRYREAIEVFGRGIERWPGDARLLRHRGHRYITVREFANAQADLQRATDLVEGRPDPIEPDGAPNPAGIPRTTLAYNIWYHLALAQFLQGDFEVALASWRHTLELAGNDDALVAATDWTWMTLMRLGRRDEAAILLQRIGPDMEILENHSYHRRLLMYQGRLHAEDLLAANSDDPVAVATQGFGIGHHRLVSGDVPSARAMFERVLAGAGWNAFGYIAAEAELRRLP
ncbi:MAG: hypothetical protein KF823_01775 [Xanthomonadales bacterium]|nr:hypothetical protein [Xanthomonadales bacterium]